MDMNDDMGMHDDSALAGTPLFDEDDESGIDARPMAGPDEETSQRIGRHLADRQEQGSAPYWPDWDD